MVFDPGYEQVLERGSDDSAQTLRVTTSEPLVLVGAGHQAAARGYRVLVVPESSDLVVRGDVVRIEGKIRAPGRAIQINARVVEVAAGAADEPASLSADGAPGRTRDQADVKPPKAASGKNGVFKYVPLLDDVKKPPGAGSSGEPGTDGRPGDPGGAAGWIDIRCHRLTSAAGPGVLALSADGGNGGAGQAGQPGQDGGNGGNGYDGYIGGVFDTDVVYPVPGANAGRGGPGGRGGAAGPGGPAGSVQLHSQGVDDVGVTLSTEPGRPGERGHDGARGDDGSPGLNGGNEMSSKHTRATGFQAAKTFAGDPPAALAAHEVISTAESFVVDDTGYEALTQTADVDQAQLGLDRVRRDGLGLDLRDHDAVRALADRVAWLVGLTAAWPDPPDQVVAVNQSMLAIAANLRSRRTDWFGHSAAWVPTASLRRYDELLGGDDAGLIGLFRRTESAWAQYRQARDDGQATQAHCRAAVNAARSQIGEWQQRQSALRDRLRETASAIEERDAPIHAARSRVEKHLEEFRKNTDTSLNLSFTQYLDVLEQAAFASAEPAQAAAVYGTEMGKYATDAFTTVAGEDGSSVNKSWLVKQTQVLGDDVRGLDEAFTVVDGFIRNEDPDGYKVLATQRQLNDALRYYEAIDGAEQAEKAMQAFVDLVLARNAMIFAYNDALADLLATASAIAGLKHRLATLSTDAAEASGPFPDPAVQAVYDAVTTACVQTLYSASRAYRFWSLRDYDVFADVLGTNGAHDITPLTIEHGQQWIRRQALVDVEQFVAALETRLDPVVVHIHAQDDATVADGLARDRGSDDLGNPLPHYWELTLDAPTRATTRDESPFVGMANVRLVEVRCYLEGLDAVADDQGNVKVHLTHGGREAIAPAHSEHDTVWHEHDAIERMFEYNVHETGADGGSAPRIETSAHYWDTESDGSLSRVPQHTPVGPFTRWRISLRPQEINGDVDWAALTGVRLEFFVRFQPFTST